MGQSNKDVKGSVLDLVGRIGVVEKKIDILHQAMRNMFNALMSLQVNTEALKALGITKDLFTEAEYDGMISVINAPINAESDTKGTVDDSAG